MISTQLDKELSEGLLLVTANRRLARAYSSAYNQLKIDAGNATWVTPDIMPLDAWLQSLHQNLFAAALSNLQLLSQEQEQALWGQALDKTTVVAGDGGDYSAALLSPVATAKALAKSWRIEHAFRQAVDPRQSPWSDYLGHDQKAYRHWSQTYAKLSANGGYIDIARLPDHLLSLLDEHKKDLTRRLPGLLPKSLKLSGFTRFTPQLENFIQHCEKAGVAVATQDPRQVPEQHIIGHAVRVGVADADTELLSCAQWARQRLLQQTPAVPHSVGVVIADLHNRRAEVQRVFDAVFFPGATPLEIAQRGRPYELSLGQSLSQTAPVVSALQILQLGFNKLSNGELSQFLLSPYLHAASAEKQQRSSFDQRQRRSGLPTVRLYQLLKWIEREQAHVEGTGVRPPAGLALLLTKMHKASKTTACQPSQWLSRIVAMLKAAGWPGETSAESIEYQAIESFRDCVDSIVELDELLGETSVGTVLTLLQRVATDSVFQPQTQAAPIQILGTLESVGLVFESLWLTGFDNESWPATQNPSPFLPLKWQKTVNAPGATPAHELEQARGYISAWEESAKEVVFSHALQDNGTPLDVSMQVQRLPEQSLTAVLDNEAITQNAMQQVHSSILCETIDDHNGPEVITDEPVNGGARLFEDQASCPFRAFALHRLRIKPLESPALGIDARSKGNYFHHAMEFFWRVTQTQDQLLALSKEQLSERIAESVESVIHNDIAEQPDLTALLEVERERLYKVVEHWVTEFEINRDSFAVIKLEEKDQVYEFASLKLRLVIDRIDELTSGGQVIIDYKTGRSNSTSSWTEERITSAQLPLYAVIMEDIQAVCFAQVAVNDLKFIGMASQKGLLKGLKGPQNDDQSWQQQLELWRGNLGMLAEEIRQGYAAVTPSKNACAYCQLPALCRISTELSEDDESDIAGEASV